jgi:hypothetical protein
MSPRTRCAAGATGKWIDMHFLPPTLALLILVAVPACAPRPLAVASLPATAVPADGALQPGQQQAFFAAYPQTLLTAARAACSSPGQAPTEPAPGAIRCETLPTPDIAAALILNFGGTVESLPLYIVSFTSTAQGGGYLVTADNFVVVPQIDGTLREVRLPDPRVDEGIEDLLIAAGGTPV